MGTQTVSVWKDSRDLGKGAADAAVALAKGGKVAGATTWSDGEKKIPMQAIFLKALSGDPEEPGRRGQGRPTSARTSCARAWTRPLHRRPASKRLPRFQAGAAGLSP